MASLRVPVIVFGIFLNYIFLLKLIYCFDMTSNASDIDWEGLKKFIIDAGYGDRLNEFSKDGLINLYRRLRITLRQQNSYWKFIDAFSPLHANNSLDNRTSHIDKYFAFLELQEKFGHEEKFALKTTAEVSEVAEVPKVPEVPKKQQRFNGRFRNRKKQIKQNEIEAKGKKLQDYSDSQAYEKSEEYYEDEEEDDEDSKSYGPITPYARSLFIDRLLANPKLLKNRTLPEKPKKTMYNKFIKLCNKPSEDTSALVKAKMVKSLKLIPAAYKRTF